MLQGRLFSDVVLRVPKADVPGGWALNNGVLHMTLGVGSRAALNLIRSLCSLHDVFAVSMKRWLLHRLHERSVSEIIRNEQHTSADYPSLSMYILHAHSN